ncbi:hypothetical protein NHH03_15500 [Stieleria sp. TO1_6]|uniref:baeRF3 domain-containing protein n=1 Tax=Stieleria tagensis TaxID=2956795 RepID=UPI00209B6FF2|nr:hypothetical protein [Stieleria tagensis]MCO8123153.1 hypothetical protein [Stieleria tagensis]
MIENPTQNELVELINKESGVCVSIVMHTHERGPKTKQNAIRFKNLMSEALDRVADRNPALTKQLTELAELENDFEFWQHQSAGYALYVCDGCVQQFKISHPLEDAVYVVDHFLVRPLAIAACGGGSTRVLAISWEAAKLYACDGHSTREINSDAFPVQMSELVPERDAEEQLQYTTHASKSGTSAGGGSTAMYHGHGEGEDKIKADREHYLSRVGKAVADEIYNTAHDLLVLATDEVAGHFSACCDVPVKQVIHASPDALNDQQISEKILQASQAVVQESQQGLNEQLGTALAQDAGAASVDQVLIEASRGRVATLLLGEDRPVWGQFNRDAGTVRLDSESHTDLANLAVRETLQSGGSVVAGSGGKDKHPIAAIYRY